MTRGQSSVTLGITGGVKMAGLPLSARGKSASGLHRSTVVPDWPASAGIAAAIANARTVRDNRMARPPPSGAPRYYRLKHGARWRFDAGSPGITEEPDMKITEVTLTLFSWDSIPPTSYGHRTARPTGKSDLGLLRIITDEGIEGHAFLGTSSNPASLDGPALIRFLKPVVIDQDPLDRERLNRLLWARARAATVRSIGAMDIALWDIAGKKAGLPIHRLIGTCRDKIPAYASSEIHAAPEQYAEQAQHYKSTGWAAYKIHPPQRWRDDIKVCEAVRKAVGDDYTVMLDSTWSYRYEEALRVGRAIEEMNFYWYEDPLADQDLYNYVKLKQKLDIPILATEYPIGGLDSYIPWVTERATDFLRGDVAVKGGITTILKAAHLAEAFRMNFETHHGGNSLNNVANLHVIMAIRNTEFFEVLLPDAMQKYGLAQDITPDRDGFVHAPTAPGLGADIDFELVERKKLGVLS
jgi:L-alanine-DL-glutamate epimerase-like enolase superfamily enzyme